MGTVIFDFYKKLRKAQIHQGRNSKIFFLENLENFGKFWKIWKIKKQTKIQKYIKHKFSYEIINILTLIYLLIKKFI